jgi:Deoxynucleotide monophosphate kinase
MIIGFAGKAASGKTTAAKQLASLLDREALIIPMAQVLREEVERFLRSCGATQLVPLLYGCQDDKLRIFHVDQARALAACPKWSEFLAQHADIQQGGGRSAATVRRILQWWGTEYRRTEDPDYWTKAWERKAAGYDLDHVHILVDDVRFLNELNVIRQLGGRLVRIDRPGFAAGGNHASETSLDGITDWDEMILNNGSLEEFREKIAALANRL